MQTYLFVKEIKMTQFFNRAYLNSIELKPRPVRTMNEALLNEAASGRQEEYDVFISHSTKDKRLIKALRQTLEEEFNLSAYIDWDEDNGMSRDDVADTVKERMKHCKSFLIVKTENSDMSSWVSWETGYYEALCYEKEHISFERIGVLLIEDEAFNKDTFLHQEYLKRYEIINEANLIEFVNEGANGIRIKRLNEDFRKKNLGVDRKTGFLTTLNTPTGTTTSYYGDR